MIEIRATSQFTSWFESMKDQRARSRIALRLDRLALGLYGDVKPVGSGVSELRVDYGPGYRVYFTKRGDTIIFLLVGGDKRSQRRDIKQAIELAAEI